MDKMKIVAYSIFFTGVVFLIIIIAILDSKLKDKEKKILETEIKLMNEKSNNNTLKNSINSLNEKIKQNEFAYEEKLKKYEDYKKQNDEEKYKNLNLIGIKSDDCNDIKDVINNIRNISF